MTHWSHEDRGTRLQIEVYEEGLMNGLVCLTVGSHVNIGEPFSGYSVLAFNLSHEKAKELGQKLLEYADLAKEKLERDG